VVFSGAATVRGALSADVVSLRPQRVSLSAAACADPTREGTIFYDGTQRVFFGCAGGAPVTLHQPASGNSTAGLGTADAPATSCAALNASGVRVNGLYWLAVPSGAVRRTQCVFDVDGGGWTLFMKAKAGSAGTFGAAGEVSVTELAFPTSFLTDGKMSDSDVRALLLSGAREVLWENVDAGRRHRLRFPDVFVSTWSSSLRYNGAAATRQYFWWNYATQTYQGVNGHVNNYVFSVWNDGPGGSNLSPAYGSNNVQLPDHTGANDVNSYLYWHDSTYTYPRLTPSHNFRLYLR
jgi:hypothetical protein